MSDLGVCLPLSFEWREENDDWIAYLSSANVALLSSRILSENAWKVSPFVRVFAGDFLQYHWTIFQCSTFAPLAHFVLYITGYQLKGCFNSLYLIRKSDKCFQSEKKRTTALFNPEWDILFASSQPPVWTVVQGRFWSNCKVRKSGPKEQDVILIHSSKPGKKTGILHTVFHSYSLLLKTFWFMVFKTWCIFNLKHETYHERRQALNHIKQQIRYTEPNQTLQTLTPDHLPGRPTSCWDLPCVKFWNENVL